MNQIAGQEVIYDFLKQLADTTEEVFAKVGDSDLNSIDHTIVLSYIESVRKIHFRLMKSHSHEEGRSRLIEKFFNHWNNIVFGVYYIDDILKKNQTLTERQHTILLTTLMEIKSYTDKHRREDDIKD